MRIRAEEAADAEAIARVTEAAFRDHPFSHQTEHFIVDALRRGGALSVSLVAMHDGTIVGHIALSPVTMSDGTAGWYGLGPISVSPSCQRIGIGSALMTEALARLKAMGAKGCVLVGDPGFYSRFGFGNPPSLAHDGVPPEYVLTLCFDGAIPTGKVVFHPAFMATA